MNYDEVDHYDQGFNYVTCGLGISIPVVVNMRPEEGLLLAMLPSLFA